MTQTNTWSAALEEILALKAQYEEVVRTKGVFAIKSAVIELFDRHPILNAIYWTQYTPYFNDGDPCTFGVNDLFFRATGIPDPNADTEWADAYYYESELNASHEIPQASLVTTVREEQLALAADMRALCDLLWTHKELALASFGDHCKVTAERLTMSFTVETQDHD